LTKIKLLKAIIIKRKSKIINKEDDKTNINNDEISVFMKDEKQTNYEFKCRINDEFSSLEKKLFDKDESLKNMKINFYINGKEIEISNTIGQNNINTGTIISFKAEKNNNEDKEEISVIIKSMNQDFKSPFICKKSDKFKDLEQKLYAKKPELKNQSLYYLHYGNIIDVNKTIEENNIKDSGVIIYNINDNDNEVYDEII